MRNSMDPAGRNDPSPPATAGGHEVSGLETVWFPAVHHERNTVKPVMGTPCQHKIVAQRTTGYGLERVENELTEKLNQYASQGWVVFDMVPIIYNSNATGYSLIVLKRRVSDVPDPENPSSERQTP